MKDDWFEGSLFDASDLDNSVKVEKKEIFRRYEEGLGGMMLGQMVRRAREKQN